MSSYSLQVEASHNQRSIELNINFNKKINFFQKSIINLSNQNISSITNKISDLFTSGSSSNITTKGFLIERSFVTKYDSGKDTFVEVIDRDFENSLSLTYTDDDENSKRKNIKTLSEILSLKDLKEVFYNISFFEIPNEELIKSEVLLTDYLLRQYYYNQNKNFSVKKMERIARKVKTFSDIDNIDEIDFFRSLTKITSKTNTILFTRSEQQQIEEILVSTELTNRNLLFKIENINDSVVINKIKIYKTNRRSKIKTIISDRSFNKDNSNLLIDNGNVYGVLFDKKTYKNFSSDKDFIYEILLKFDIYKSDNPSLYRSKEVLLRL